MSILNQLKEEQLFTNAEQVVVRYILKHPRAVINATIGEIAEAAYSSPSTIGRVCKKVGVDGFAQLKIKLATELSRRGTGKTIYVLDEPTTGLHFADVHKLVDILRKLSQGGNTVVVIEHNLDVIKTADYIIDMGPEGGDKGGTVVTCGTPEEVARCPQSYTGQYVKRYLER